MRRARRLPKRLVRLTTLSVCLALILIALAMAPLPNVNSRETSPQVQGRQGSGKAWNGDASILNLFNYPAFHSFNYSALHYLRYASLEFYQALSDSPFTLSLSSVSELSNESGFNLPLTPMPYGNGYTYSRSITFDHSKVPNTDQSNFPVLISGAYSYLKTVANGGDVQNSNGYDVIFTSDSGCATKLNHEVETYNATTGAATTSFRA